MKVLNSLVNPTIRCEKNYIPYNTLRIILNQHPNHKQYLIRKTFAERSRFKSNSIVAAKA